MTAVEDAQEPPALGIAAGHATDRVPIARPSEEAGEARARLIGASFDCADDVAVVRDDRSLAGLVPIERLLEADPATPVDDLMDADPPVVGPGTDEERIAWKMVSRGESSIAVVDDVGRFLGLVPPARLVGALLAAHDEDIARLGGYIRGSDRARSAAEEAVPRRLWHRLPWLTLGLIGATASAAIVGSFEQDLSANVLLAFFMPGLVYMADAVGTQTEALVIRALAIGVPMRHAARRELVTGLLVGAAMGAAFYGFVALAYGDERVALTVGLALAVSCTVATVIAMALPVAFHRLGRDPAFGSGPLATVIQDLLSITVYFLLAIWLVA